MKNSKKTKIVGYCIEHNKKTPIIVCKSRKDIPYGMEFYCEHCKKYHKHGEGDGHRVAHCVNQNSPFFNTGYVVILERDYSFETRKAIYKLMEAQIKLIEDEGLIDKQMSFILNLNVKQVEI